MKNITLNNLGTINLTNIPSALTKVIAYYNAGGENSDIILYSPEFTLNPV